MTSFVNCLRAVLCQVRRSRPADPIAELKRKARSGQATFTDVVRAFKALSDR